MHLIKVKTYSILRVPEKVSQLFRDYSEIRKLLYVRSEPGRQLSLEILIFKSTIAEYYSTIITFVSDYPADSLIDSS